MAKEKIVLKIRKGDITAEGHGFKGKSCEDKMAFLNKVGTQIGKTTKKGDEPAPAPRIHTKN